MSYKSKGEGLRWVNLILGLNRPHARLYTLTFKFQLSKRFNTSVSDYVTLDAFRPSQYFALALHIVNHNINRLFIQNLNTNKNSNDKFNKVGIQPVLELGKKQWGMKTREHYKGEGFGEGACPLFVQDFPPK